MDDSNTDLNLSSEHQEQTEDVNIEGIDDLTLDESDTEALTAAQVIELMESAWLNEKFSPEILPHKLEVVECLLGQISCMDENIQNLESNNFQKALHQMEVDRLRYLVTSYLRNRLEKIEMYSLSILSEEEIRSERNEESYLTSGELQFAKDYKAGLEQHFDNVLSFWPGLPVNDWKKEPITPNQNSFVFMKSKANIDGVVLDDEHEEDLVDFKVGSQIIISYSSISNLVKKADVQLI